MYGDHARFRIIDRTSGRIARKGEDVLDLGIHGKAASVIQVDCAALLVKPPVPSVLGRSGANHAAYRARWAPQLSQQSGGVTYH